MSAIKDFFWADKKSLMQSLADGAFRAIFSGLIISVAGLFVIGEVETHIERSQKRAALLELQNSTLSNVITEFGEAYVSIDCARNSTKLLEPTCKSELDALISLLSTRAVLLSALLPGGDFSSIAEMQKTAQSMRKLRPNPQALDQSKELIKQFSAVFTKMMGSVAKNFN